MAQLCGNLAGSPSSGGSLSPQPYGQPSTTGPQPSGYVGLQPATQSQYQNVLAGGGYQGPQGNYGPSGGMDFGAKPVVGRGSAEGIDQVLAGIRPGTGAEHTGYGGNMYNGGPAMEMGYAGSGPGGNFSPVQLPWGQPSQGAAQGAAQGMGGVLGAMSPRPMSQRDIQMMARYLPGSGTTVDPNASPNALANRFGGNFRNMVPQRLQGRFDEMQRMAGGGGMGSYQDALNNPVIGAMIRRKGYL